MFTFSQIPCVFTYLANKADSDSDSEHACFWAVGGSQSTRREPSYTQGEHPNSTLQEPAENITRNPLAVR